MERMVMLFVAMDYLFVQCVREYNIIFNVVRIDLKCNEPSLRAFCFEMYDFLFLILIN